MVCLFFPSSYSSELPQARRGVPSGMFSFLGGCGRSVITLPGAGSGVGGFPRALRTRGNLLEHRGSIQSWAFAKSLPTDR